MRICSDCGKKFGVKVRIKACFDKNNTLRCESCGSKFSQPWLYSKISFYIPAIIYLILSHRITMMMYQFVNNMFLSIIFAGIIAFLWVIAFIFVSQFWFKYEKGKYL